MKRWPLFPALLVALAVATMVVLGIWQLQRKAEKEAQIALFASNRSKPSVTFPELGPIRDEAMFRRSTAMCMQVIGWRSSSGKDADGKPGIRYIAECKTGAEGPGLLVVAGIADRPDLKPQWSGGPANGTIVPEPDARNMFERAIGRGQVLRPMLVSDKGVAGLRAHAQPNPQDMPNNHLLYAIQWFIFAGAAAVIFVLAVRKRRADG